MALILRCRACAHQDHKSCEGTPEDGTCHCRQCWTRHIMEMARQYMDSNNHAMIRTTMTALYAIQSQTQMQKQKLAAKKPRKANCAVCGAVVQVRERRAPGLPVYCRGTSRCRVRAYRQRKRQQEQGQVTVTPDQDYDPSAGSIRADAMTPTDLWFFLHGR